MTSRRKPFYRHAPRTQIKRARCLLSAALLLLACDDGSVDAADLAEPAHDAGVEVPPSLPPPDAATATAPTSRATMAPDAASCAEGLICAPVRGVYVCERPGPSLILCDRADECPASAPTCIALDGQGVCRALCRPPEDLPRETTIRGVVTEYQPGVGRTGSRERAREPLLPEVEVCLLEPSEKERPTRCTRTAADGTFVLEHIAPNRNQQTSVGGALTFRRPGYLAQAQTFVLGLGEQTLDDVVRLLSVPYASELAQRGGGSLPDATTGWLIVSATRLDRSGRGGSHSSVTGGERWRAVELVTVTADPVAGVGPLYTDADERVAPLAEVAPGERATSAAGTAFFLNVPAAAPGATQYRFDYRHPTLHCSDAPISAQALAGFVVPVTPVVCGRGVAP